MEDEEKQTLYTPEECKFILEILPQLAVNSLKNFDIIKRQMMQKAALMLKELQEK